MKVESRAGDPRALLKITYACNNRCVFCHAAEHRRVPASPRELILRKAQAARDLGIRMIVLSGGEPTVRKDFFSLLEGIRALGLQIGLCTNGRLLAYPEFAERFLSYHPGYLYVSLHGADEQTHDRLVRARAFGQTLRGLENVRGRCPEITVNIVVHNENLGGLADLVTRLAPLAPLRVKFSLLEPKGAALAEGRFLAPDVAEAASGVMNALRAGEQRHARAGLTFSVDGFPPCLIPEYDRLNADLEADGILYMSETFENGFFPVDAGRRGRHPDCAVCARCERCPGIFEAYLNGFGGFRPRPIPRTVPNSFAYIHMGDAFAPAAGDCPVPGQRLDALSPARDLILRENGRLRVYHTDTRDFSDEQVERTKRALGQLYVERNGRSPATRRSHNDSIRRPRSGAEGATLHFRHHLRKLAPAESCRSCDRRAACAGVYVEDREDPFRASEERIRGLLAALRGAVVDVGCGESFYAKLWVEKARRKEIEYLGIDPHPPRARRGLNFVKAAIEDFETGKRPVDAVVVLRSYNHFRDLSTSLAKLVKALRPGGDLVLVDNTVFGVVRREGLPPKGAFEHYRNHTSFEVIEALRDLPVRVVEHMPITPDTGNQWLVHAKKVT